MTYAEDTFEKSIQQKAPIALGVLMFCMLALIGRLYWLQCHQHDYYQKKAFGQQWKKKILPNHRGTIKDRQGNILAISVPGYSCYANPQAVENPEEVAEQLSLLLDKKSAFLSSRLKRKNRKFIWLKRQLAEEQYEKVKALDIRGIGFRKESRRAYPGGKFAAHVLGFVGLENKGLEGIEANFQKELSGQPGYTWQLVDGRLARYAIYRSEAPGIPPVNGADIYLTLDYELQEIAEQQLEKAVEKFRPKKASAILLSVKTGEVLAMTSRPNFDSNHYQKSPQNSWRNIAITDSYELGSVVKPLVAGACMGENLVHSKTIINCHNGAYRIKGRTLHDHHRYGDLTVAEILIYSSNIGAAQLGEMFGAKKLHTYLQHLGLGNKSKIYLPGESSGILKNHKYWTPSTMLSIPMGHEISMTPLQLVSAFTTLVGDGIYRPPYIVRKIVYPDGKEQHRYLPPNLVRIFPMHVVKEMRNILREVVVRGTAKRANIKGAFVGGKTGTAQKIVDGRYSHSKHVASFVGFAPYYKPMYCCIITVDEPVGSSYGGVVAAPYVAEILRQAVLIKGGRP